MRVRLRTDFDCTERRMIVSTIRYEDRSEPQSTEAPHGAGTSRSAVRTATGPDRRARGVTRTRERRAFANELARTLHDRMPVIVPEQEYDAWLDPARSEVAIDALCAPREWPGLALRPVSRRLGNVRFDDAALLIPEGATLAPDGSPERAAEATTTTATTTTARARRPKPPRPVQGTLL
jgi:hypothetical protein